MSYSPKSEDVVSLGNYRGNELKVALPGKDDYIQSCVRADRCLWGQGTLGWVLKYIPENANVVDIGAYIGSSALWLVRYAGAKSVVAIEPDPVSYGILRANVGLNGLDGIIIPVQRAVWDSVGSAYLSADSINNHGAAQYRPCRSDASWSVPMADLDTILKGRSGKIDFIYTEMEGYEYKAFHGARSVLARDSPVVVVTTFGMGDITIRRDYDGLQGYSRLTVELAEMGYFCDARHGRTSVFVKV